MPVDGISPVKNRSAEKQTVHRTLKRNFSFLVLLLLAGLNDAHPLAGVGGAALQDELRTGPRRDDRSFLLRLALGAGFRHFGNVVC